MWEIFLHDLLHGRAIADEVLGFSTFEYEAVHQPVCRER